MSLPRPHAHKPTDLILHEVREILAAHQASLSEAGPYNTSDLVTLADLVEELDQRLSTGGALPCHWRHHR